MACNDTPLSCLDPTNIFAGIYNANCAGFADPSRLQAEKSIFSSGYGELINNYGVDINYYVHGFTLSAANILYGEHPLAEFSPPFQLRSYIELTEGFTLSQYGHDSSDELTAYFHIDTFENTFITYLLSEDGSLILAQNNIYVTVDTPDSLFFSSRGLRLEPKSGDLIEVTSLGCNRPGNRGAKIFEITEAVDQDVANGLNPMGGHFVWRVKAVRYDYNGQTNAPRERGDDQVYDNNHAGKISSTLFPTLTTGDKIYTDDVDTISKEQVYDMRKMGTDLYGKYY